MRYNKIIFILFLTNILSKEIDLSNQRNRNDDFLKLFSQSTRNLKDNSDEEVSEDMCAKRPNPFSPNMFYFIPALKAKLKKVGDQSTFKAGCFKKNIATLTKVSKEELVIELDISEKESVFCNDVLIIHTSNLNNLHANFLKGKHKITLKNLSQDDLDEISINGIKILGFCQGVIGTIQSLIYSLTGFIGGLGYDPNAFFPLFRPTVPDYMIKTNLETLKLYNNYTPERRKDILLDLDEKLIHTGDFIGISRLDGVDPMIMLGTGSHIGHTCVCAWIDGELYVLESQDGWYWPYHGIQRNKFKDWVRLAHIADFNVVILPLSEESRKKFNETKAIEWFKNGIEGLNYGYHNFIFSWLDTTDSNLPFIMKHEHVEFLLSIFEKITKPLADKIIGEAVNHRVGTKGLSIHEVVAEGARQGKTFEEILAMPEIEGWEYSDGLNYVCSCFVTAFYKHGGLFDGLEILPNEFTPKDVYQLDIFDKEYKRPKECVDADPNLPYCQIMGKFRIDLPGYSTIKPYSNMNERCPSIGPDFYRPDGC